RPIVAQLRVATDEDRGARRPTGANRLPVTAGVPPVDQERIEFSATNLVGDVPLALSKHHMVIATHQIGIPGEGHTEANALLFWRWNVGEIHREIRLTREHPVEWRIVLNRVRRENPEAFFHCHASSR